MRLFCAALLICSGLANEALAQGPEPDFELWTTGIASGVISGKLLGHAEVSIRIDDRGTRRETLLLRPAIGVQVSKKVSLWAGYVRLNQYPQGRAGTRENRYFQQLSVAVGKVGPGTLTLRTRMEERTLEGAQDLGWRIRQQARYTLPIKGTKTSFVFHTEPFFALNSTDWGARPGLDQWRNFAGLAIPLTKGVSLDAGYMNRYVRRVGARDRIDHIVPLTVNWRF